MVSSDTQCGYSSHVDQGVATDQVIDHTHDD